MRPAVARTSATPPQACIQRFSCWARAHPADPPGDRGVCVGAFGCPAVFSTSPNFGIWMAGQPGYVHDSWLAKDCMLRQKVNNVN